MYPPHPAAIFDSPFSCLFTLLFVSCPFFHPFFFFLVHSVPLGDGGERSPGATRGVSAEGAGAKVVEPQDHEPVDAEVLPVPGSVRLTRLTGRQQVLLCCWRCWWCWCWWLFLLFPSLLFAVNTAAFVLLLLLLLIVVLICFPRPGYLFRPTRTYIFVRVAENKHRQQKTKEKCVIQLGSRCHNFIFPPKRSLNRCF